MRQMMAAVTHRAREMSLERRPVPAPGPGEVLVKVRHVGICGSDLHFYRYGFERENLFPKILGHECSGEVVAFGDRLAQGVAAEGGNSTWEDAGFGDHLAQESKVLDGQGKPLAPGDLVAVEPGAPCGECEWCRRGEYNLCPNLRFLSAFHDDGCLCEYLAFPARMCHRLPAGMDTLCGAMLEPFAVGLHAAARGGAAPGKSAALVGAGCIGIMTLLSLRLHGVEEVFVHDLSDFRLKRAQSLGALSAGDGDFTAGVLECTGGRGVDIAVDCTGSAAGAYSLPGLCRRGGVCVQVGNIGHDAPFDYYNFYEKELQLRGVFRYRGCYPAAIAAVAAGRVDLRALADRVFPFTESPGAFEYALAHSEEALKVMIEF